ncbi:hypothetical protein CHARACLAT_012273 [Characodon lateralis]|uniref:Uncharacterized protein n=1 Tax=Characodon lateralis TaxID=208331 RepID=A0ABU7DGG3_9TELE|nr:hypothetical protein [Characodon lateralis]
MIRTVRKSGQTVAARLRQHGQPRERTGISHTPDIELFIRAAPESSWQFQLKLRSQLNTTVCPNMLLLFKD